MTVIIWNFDPETLELKMSRTLEQHSHGISFFAWSPDSTRLAVCGPEDCDEVSYFPLFEAQTPGPYATHLWCLLNF